jgi:hypothetical protein
MCSIVWLVETVIISYPEVPTEARTRVHVPNLPFISIYRLFYFLTNPYYIYCSRSIYKSKHPSQLHIGPDTSNAYNSRSRRSWAFRLFYDPSMDSDTELMSVNGKTTASLIFFDVATALSTPFFGKPTGFVLEAGAEHIRAPQKNPGKIP